MQTADTILCFMQDHFLSSAAILLIVVPVTLIYLLELSDGKKMGATLIVQTFNVDGGFFKKFIANCKKTHTYAIIFVLLAHDGTLHVMCKLVACIPFIP